MKIVVKHLGSEIEVSDNQAMEDGRGLLYHNWNYSKELLVLMINQIKELNKTEGDGQ